MIIQPILHTCLCPFFVYYRTQCLRRICSMKIALKSRKDFLWLSLERSLSDIWYLPWSSSSSAVISLCDWERCSQVRIGLGTCVSSARAARTRKLLSREIKGEWKLLGVDWGNGGRFRIRMEENSSVIVLMDFSLPSPTPRMKIYCDKQGIDWEHTSVRRVETTASWITSAFFAGFI